MADTARSIEIVSVDDYLARERASAYRSEFVNGAVYAMSGGSQRHNLIAVNLTSALTSHLPDRCTAFLADMKVRVRVDESEFVYYPDCMVCYGPYDQSRDWRSDPLVIAEVLSTSTERIDRTEKFNNYTRIETLQEYLLIDQSMARVEVFRRSTGWQREVFLTAETFRLESISFESAVDALYRRVEF